MHQKLLVTMVTTLLYFLDVLISKSELFHLNHLFGDNPPIQSINNYEDIKYLKIFNRKDNN